MTALSMERLCYFALVLVLVKASVRVDVVALRHAAGARLGHAVELRGGGAGDRGDRRPLAVFRIRRKRPVVGEHRLIAIAVQHVDALALERVDILRKHEAVGALRNHGFGRQHEHLVQLLDTDADADLLPGTKSPKQLRRGPWLTSLY